MRQCTACGVSHSGPCRVDECLTCGKEVPPGPDFCSRACEDVFMWWNDLDQGETLDVLKRIMKGKPTKTTFGLLAGGPQ